MPISAVDQQRQQQQNGDADAIAPAAVAAATVAAAATVLHAPKVRYVEIAHKVFTPAKRYRTT